MRAIMAHKDHGFVAGGQVFIVADGAAVLADPGEGALDHPAAGQHLKDVPVALGHDLHGHLQGGGPGDQLAGGVSGVGPDQQDLRAGAVEVPQQRPGAVAVLDAGGGDHHGQQQPDRVHGDVPFAAVDLLRVVPAPAGLWHGVGGADGLGVDHRGGGLGVAPGGHPDLAAQRVMQPGQGAVVAPGGEVAVDGLPGREVRRQVPPGAPGPVQGQDRIDDPPQRPDARPAPAAGLGCGQVRRDHLPLRVGQVTEIPPGWARTVGTRGPRRFLIVTHRDHGARARHLTRPTRQPHPRPSSD